MAIEIVTGFQGKPHVTANDDGSYNQGVVGTKDYVMGVGKMAKATLVSNNSVRIDDAELVMQGVHFRILPGTYETVTINNGNQGQKRKDAIVARYTKDSSSGIENITLAVLQGTPTTGTPVAQVPTKGDIRSGALKHEMLLHIVELDGLNVVSVTPSFEILMSMKELQDGLGELNSKSIVETGSNANGNYIKYADGTLEMWGVKSAEYICKTTAGSGYVSTGIPITFPIASKSECVVTVQKIAESIEATYGGISGKSTKTGVTAFVLSLFQISSVRIAYFHWRATGTWK